MLYICAICLLKLYQKNRLKSKFASREFYNLRCFMIGFPPMSEENNKEHHLQIIEGGAKDTIDPIKKILLAQILEVKTQVYRKTKKIISDEELKKITAKLFSGFTHPQWAEMAKGSGDMVGYILHSSLSRAGIAKYSNKTRKLLDNLGILLICDIINYLEKIEKTLTCDNKAVVKELITLIGANAFEENLYDTLYHEILPMVVQQIVAIEFFGDDVDNFTEAMIGKYCKLVKNLERLNRTVVDSKNSLKQSLAKP